MASVTYLRQLLGMALQLLPRHLFPALRLVQLVRLS